MKKYIFGGAALLAVILAVIFIANRSEAQRGSIEYHGFYGTITYRGCECTEQAYADKVYVKELPDGIPVYVGVLCEQGVGSYDTEASIGKVFAPGTYQLWMEFYPGQSECDSSSVAVVEHGYSKQQVNLSAYGSGE